MSQIETVYWVKRFIKKLALNQFILKRINSLGLLWQYTQVLNFILHWYLVELEMFRNFSKCENSISLYENNIDLYEKNIDFERPQKQSPGVSYSI